MARGERAPATGARRRATARDLAVGDAVFQVEFLHSVDEVLIRQAHRVAQERPHGHVLEQHAVEAVFQTANALLKISRLAGGEVGTFLHIANAHLLMQVPKQIDHEPSP
jgi:hypothetical protein